MKLLALAALLIAGCSTAHAGSGPSEYRSVGCSTYGETAVTYSGIDRRVLERSVIAVAHDDVNHSLVLFPHFVTVPNGVSAQVTCYGSVDFVREL